MHIHATNFLINITWAITFSHKKTKSSENSDLEDHHNKGRIVANIGRLRKNYDLNSKFWKTSKNGTQKTAKLHWICYFWTNLLQSGTKKGLFIPNFEIKVRKVSSDFCQRSVFLSLTVYRNLGTFLGVTILGYWIIVHLPVYRLINSWGAETCALIIEFSLLKYELKFSSTSSFELCFRVCSTSKTVLFLSLT